MKKGIVYCLFKINNNTQSLIECIKEVNVSADSASYYNYPKCLIISDSISEEFRKLIDFSKFDHVIEFKQRFNSLADKLLVQKYTPFDKNIVVDSDIIFLNEKSYDILQFNDNHLLEMPLFSIEHLFEQKFALCADLWCFKKLVKNNNIIRYTYNPLSFEFLYQKYNFRDNVFTYNNSVMVFEKNDSHITKLFDEALDNAEYLCNIRDTRKLNFNPCDQVCLDFAISNQKIFPSYIHETFKGPIKIKDDKLFLDRPIIMAHSSNAIKYIVDKKIKIF